MRQLAVLALLAAATGVAAEPVTLSGDGLRQFVAGKTVHLETPVGTLPITYNENGTLTGRASGLALTAYLGSSTDRGRWSIEGNRICQKFFRWLSGEMSCITIRQDGRRITWRRDDGMTGTATIAANEAAPPPAPSGLGVRPDERPERPAQAPEGDQPLAETVARVKADAMVVASLGPQLPARSIARVPEADAADEAEPQLIEPPTPVARPPRFAIASLGPAALPLALPSLIRPEPAPQAHAQPAAAGSLPALARDIWEQRALHHWCQADDGDADHLPALVAIALDVPSEPGSATPDTGCLTPEPPLPAIARLGAGAR